MGKLDKLRQKGVSFAAESMGAGVPGSDAPGSALHGARALGPSTVPEHLLGVTRNKNAAIIPVEKIGPDPEQPREEFDEAELQRLAESLRTRGQLQPISVYWDASRSLYVIVCGERRWRAATIAGLPTLTASVLSQPPEAGERLALQCIENLLRSDLNPVEEAKAYRQLLALNHWNAAQLSRELSISESKITRALALLSLPEPIQDEVDKGALSPATAYEISKIDNPDEQAELAGQVAEQKLTRKDTAQIVRERKQSKSSKRKVANAKDDSGDSKRESRLVHFDTRYGKVSVNTRHDAVVEALEEALAQARQTRDPTIAINNEAA